MGGTSFSASAYEDLSRSYSTKSKETIFTSRIINPEMDPKGVDFREARDSDAHPNSFPIIIALDVTGSMGKIPENLIKNKLGKLMEILINNGVSDASVCFVGVGDHLSDSSPLQIGQFESGTDELDKCLTSIHLEGGGGPWGQESYNLAWLFGARHTSIDSFEKRKIKGFIFTIGDEWVHDTISANYQQDKLGYKQASDVSSKDLLEEAKKTYNVFHIHCNDASCSTRDSEGKILFAKWKDLLGQNALEVDDSNDVAEVIASTVALINGADMKDLLKGMDSGAAKTVSTALATIKREDIAEYGNVGVIKL